MTKIDMPKVKIGEEQDPRILATKDTDKAVKVGAGMKKIHFTQHAG